VTVLEENEDDDEEDCGSFALAQDANKPAIPKAKLLQFHENQRPAYWGTWTKKSDFVSGRKPFGQDKDRFDYEYDSDEEWEEEPEGESLSDNEEDKDEEKEGGEDEYEVDNDFFVPHGYLSDEENERGEDEVFDPEKEKEKLKLKGEEFEAEHKKKNNKKKMHKTWGVFYEGDATVTEAAACQLIRILSPYSGILVSNNNAPIDTGVSLTGSCNGSPSGLDDVMESAKVKAGKGAVKTVPVEALPDVVKLVHGNPNNKLFLAKEFIEFWSRKQKEQVSPEEVGTPCASPGNAMSKRQMVKKIEEIAEFRSDPAGGRKWFVKEEFLKGVEDVSPSNTWDYILDPPNANTPAGSRPVSPNGKASTVAAPSPANLITKFAKVLSAEEKEAQRVKKEKEAQELKEKKEAKKKLEDEAAAKAAKEKEAEVEVLAISSPSVPTGIAKFTKVLSAEEKAKILEKSSVKKNPISALIANDSPKPSPKPAKRKSNLGKDESPVQLKRALNGVKAVKKNSPKASPITVKKTSTQPTASPIAIKRKPNVIANLPSKVSPSPVRSSPRKKEPVEEIIIE